MSDSIDDPLAIPLNRNERIASQLVGVDAKHLEDLWVALFTGPDPSANTATRGVLLGVFASAAWRAGVAAGIGAIGIGERDRSDAGHAPDTPIGRVLDRQGVAATVFLPDFADLIAQAVTVSAQAVGIDRIRDRES